jgi:hypothetical protein
MMEQLEIAIEGALAAQRIKSVGKSINVSFFRML